MSEPKLAPARQAKEEPKWALNADWWGSRFGSLKSSISSRGEPYERPPGTNNSSRMAQGQPLRTPANSSSPFICYSARSKIRFPEHILMFLFLSYATRTTLHDSAQMSLCVRSHNRVQIMSR